MKETKICKHCNMEMSKKTKICPNCGKKQGGIVKKVVIAYIVIVVLASAFGGSNDDNKTKEISTEVKEKEEIKNDTKEKITQKETNKKIKNKYIKNKYIKSCKEYNYKDVLRNPKKYIGKQVKVKIKISSVHEDGWLNDEKYYFGNAKDDYEWYGDEYAIYDKRSSENPKLLEDDIIEVYGEILEPEETTSLITNSSELFTIAMKYVKLIQG